MNGVYKGGIIDFETPLRSNTSPESLRLLLLSFIVKSLVHSCSSPLPVHVVILFASCLEWEIICEFLKYQSVQATYSTGMSWECESRSVQKEQTRGEEELKIG